MKRKLFGVLAALLLAAAGTFVLLLYVQAAEDRALAGEEVVEVYVVEAPIERGTAGEDITAQVALSRIPAKAVAAGSVDRLQGLEGKVAAVDLVPGEQVLSTRFVTPEDLSAQAQVEVPPDLHEVTVALDPERAVGGTLRPGDTVGVLASFDPFQADEAGIEVVDPEDPPGKTPNSTHMILHKVLVTNVQQQGGHAGSSAAPPGTAGDDGEEEAGVATAPTGTLLVTLAIDAPAVERVVFSAEHGRVWLSQEPEAAPEDGTRIQVRDSVYR